MASWPSCACSRRHYSSPKGATLRCPTLSVPIPVGRAAHFEPPPITANFRCVSNGCCDQHEWCRFWAVTDECQRNLAWMRENCQLACDSCPRPAPTPRKHHSPFISAQMPPPSPRRPLPPPPLSPIIQSPFIPRPSPSAGQPPDSAQQTAAASVASHLDWGVCQIHFGQATSCSEIARNPSNAAEQLARSGLLNPVEDASSRQTLALDDISSAAKAGCVPELSSPGDCSHSLCFHLAFRSLDGVCNNLRRPLLGASFRPYKRLLPPEYDNGFSEPISTLFQRRPSAREVCRQLLSSGQMVADPQLNSLMMQWGQFISHDVARTTLQPTANCGTCSSIPGKCMAVPISDKDGNDGFRQKGCLKMSRSAPVCGTGNPGRAREQLNENTAFVDGSQIYGSSPRDLHKFRDGRTGLLKLTRFNNLMVLPFDETKCTGGLSDCTASFTAGDVRANLFLGLSSMHILFAREHNRVARALQAMSPGWSGDRVFQEARKLVGAQIQLVLYRDYLPRVLGQQFDRLIGPYRGYDPQVDPSISNAFTTTAYRFGHGMILEQYPRLGDNRAPIFQGPFAFGEGVFKSQKLLFEGGIDPVLRGLWSTPVKKPRRMTPAITERMFGTTDLGSLNIMRGRDNGIPAYNKWRQFCGMSAFSSFAELTDIDENMRRAIAANYPTPDDLDLYVGGMLEAPVPGGLIGPTMACIIANQFKRSRDGDRFYFENPGVFTPAQLAEIRKASLSRILCDNGDRITEVPAQAFLLGGEVPCSAIPQLDLSKWRE